jgi:hypothetical protein
MKMEMIIAVIALLGVAGTIDALMPRSLSILDMLAGGMLATIAYKLLS